MSNEFSKEICIPTLLETQAPVLPRAGRFVETNSSRIARGIFPILCKYTPTLAAHMAFKLLARPPRPKLRDSHLAQRKKAIHRTIKSGANELNIYEWGSGPPVLLVHGWGSHATQMSHVIKPLVMAGFRVISFDAPAHGLSSRKTTDLVEFASSIALVAASIGKLHAIVAHSFGAAMSLFAARDWGINTERMVLISTFDHFNWFLGRFGEHIGLTSAVLERVRKIQVARYGGRLNWSQMSVADMARTSGLSLLVVHDEDDKEIPIEHGLNVAKASRTSCFHKTRRLGHQLIVRNPAVITNIVNFIVADSQSYVRE
jgi:pimeloyl-ACP methyl ester carboxylesterase